MMKAAVLTVAATLVVTTVLPASPASAEQPVVCYKYSYDRKLVRAVQRKLEAWGYEPGPVDGFWGPTTEAALTVFQGQMNLAASGHLDEATLRTMFGEPLPPGVKVVRNPMRLPADVFAEQCK